MAKESKTGRLALALAHAFLEDMILGDPEQVPYTKNAIALIKEAEKAHGQDIIEWPAKPRAIVLITLKQIAGFTSDAAAILALVELTKAVQDAQLTSMLRAQQPAGNA